MSLDPAGPLDSNQAVRLKGPRVLHLGSDWPGSKLKNCVTLGDPDSDPQGFLSKREINGQGGQIKWQGLIMEGVGTPCFSINTTEANNIKI